MNRRFLFAFVLLVLALALIGCATMAEEPGEPEPTTMSEASPTAQATATVPAAATSEPLLPTPTPQVEERVAEVEWPASMRVGDNDVIRLSVFPAPEDYVPQVEIEGHEVAPAEVPLAVSRPGYTGYAIAKLSAAGLTVEPASPEEQLLVPGQPNTWRWTISPDKAATYRAVINLSVRWVPEPGADLPGPFEESAWSRTLTIEARSTLGLSGKQTDLMGVGGSVLGAISGVPFAEKLGEVLWKQLKRRLKKPDAASAPGGKTGTAGE